VYITIHLRRQLKYVRLRRFCCLRTRKLLRAHGKAAKESNKKRDCLMWKNARSRMAEVKQYKVRVNEAKTDWGRLTMS